MRMLHPFLFCLLLSLPALMQGQSVTISPTKDNTLYQSPSGALSNGTGIYLFSGRTKQASNALRRTVLQFDVAGNVPAGATITGATLTLTMNKGTGVSHAHSLFALSQAWGEGSTNASGNEGAGGVSTTNSATWIHTFFSGSNWTTAGGDFAATASAITNVGGASSYNWSSPGVTADVQGWYANPSTNFGWILTGNETSAGSSKRFASRENPISSARPKLVVTYTLPCVDPDIPTLSATAPTFCPGDTIGITVTGGSLNDATAWHLYETSCGGTLIASNVTGQFAVTPTGAASYFVRGEGGCVTPGSCATVGVTPNPSEDAGFGYTGGGVFCLSATTVSPVITGTPGGTFSASSSDLMLDPATGNIAIGMSVPGSYQVTYMTPGIDCIDSSTVTVVINDTPVVNDTVAICQGDSLLFDGQFLTVEGDYTGVFQTVAGCDSTVNLRLDLRTAFNVFDSVSICQGDSVILGTQVIKVPGTYSETFQAGSGCDSTVNLVVTQTNVDVSVSQTDSTLTAAVAEARYQWIDCSTNTAIAGATNRSFTPSSSGEYAVEVEVNGCVDTSTCVVVDIANSLKDELQLDVVAAPNPTEGMLQIRLGQSFREASVQVYSLQGQLVLTTEVRNSDQAELDVSSLPSGMYILTIQSEDKRGSLKVKKE